MVAFTYFAKVKNKYCIAYFGLVPEYVIQLQMLRPFLKDAFPDVTLFISCRDEFMFMLNGENDIIPFSKIYEQKYDFAYIRELPTSIKPPHSVYQLVQESIPSLKIESVVSEQTSRQCLVCPDGALPTKSFTDSRRLKTYAESRGYHVKIVGSDYHPSQAKVDIRPTGLDKFDLVAKSDWVIGVENEFLYDAVRRGVKTTLVPTGIGTSLYKLMCPKGELLEL